MKSLVTGANGFVGSAIARYLLEAGQDVCVLVRAESNRKNLKGLDIEIMNGDLRDPDSLARACKNCNYLFHVAADYRLWIPRPEEMYKINVEGTENLMLAAADANIERIVYTSSVATLGYNRDNSPANEDTPSSLDTMIGHYKRSKFLAEQKVRMMVEQFNLPVVIVNPSTPIGPRDIKPTPTGKIVVDTLNGNMPAYVNTGLNIVHVDDVARGHYLALQSGHIGERYILGGENISLQQILGTIDEITGIHRKRVRLPHLCILPIAWCMGKISLVTGKEPRATVDSVRMAQKFMYFSSEKAAKNLGYTFRPARQALEDAIQWFVDNGYVK